LVAINNVSIENQKSKIDNPNMADKLTEVLVEALKQALAEPTEQRLYRSGKLAGLFPGRSGLGGEAAAQALRDGLLEVVRTETKGKTTIEWVKATPRGVTFLHDRESPLRVLQELLGLLRTNREGVPGWLAEIRTQLAALGDHLAEDTRRWTNRLEALTARVEEALRRASAAAPQLSDGMAANVPWGLDALTYLFRRQTGGMAGDCTLPELFRAVSQQHADLAVQAFHEGLRRLHDRGALRLVPFDRPADQLPEPEFALVDGAAVYYYVSR
jgi:hypothetical protein